MSPVTESKTINLDDWILRIREPDGAGPHPVVIMLHGWTGDEDVMWIFAPRLPENALLIAPRGLHKAPLGGYSWHPHRSDSFPDIDEFRPAANALLDLLTPQNFPGAQLEKIRLVGFSQGAALTYTFSLLNPDRIKSFAGMAGFMPGGAEALLNESPLTGIPAFVTHGTQDEIVRIDRARQSVSLLEKAGAEVTFCEDNVGHKLSLTCFKGLQTFFERH